MRQDGATHVDGAANQAEREREVPPKQTGGANQSGSDQTGYYIQISELVP